MYLTDLKIEGLKNGNGSFAFNKEITCFFGANGSGKTTILQAIHLLLKGRAPRSIGHASTGKDIIAMSSNGKIQIWGTWSTGEKLIIVERSWTKSGSSVKEALSQNIESSCTGVKEQQGLLNLYFGTLPEIWNPEAFFDLSSKKMRGKLLASISSRPVRDVLPQIKNIIGKTLPHWADPTSLEITAETWIHSVIKESDDRIRESQAEVRSCNRQLDEEPEFVRYRPEKEVEAELAAMAEKRTKIIQIHGAKEELKYLEGRQSALKDSLADVEIDIETKKATLEEMEEDAPSLDEINTQYTALAEEYKVIGAQHEIKEQRVELKEQADMAEREIREYKDVRKRMQSSEEHLLMEAKRPFEEAIASVVGKDCHIDLSNGQCRIIVGNVDVAGLSDGETLSLIPGIVAGLARNADAKWLPLPLDRFEAISKDRRGPFIEAIQKLIKEGVLSQAIIAGCPDSYTVEKENGEVLNLIPGVVQMGIKE